MNIYINNEIIDICSKHLGIDGEIMQVLYEQIKQKTIPGKNHLLVLSKSDLNLKGINGTEHFMLTGLDLPIIINNESSSGKRVMIIGAEPLRSWDSFKDEGRPHRYGDILVNTPYSIHQPDIEKTVYGKIINYLVQSNEVYLTDVRKIWFAGFEFHKPFLSANTHSDFLSAEIELFQPDLIFTFGKNTKTVINNSIVHSKIPVYYLIHPSRRTQGQMRRNFFKERGIEIDNYLNINDVTHRESQPFIDLIELTIKSI